MTFLGNLFKNKEKNYNQSYFTFNHLRHLKSWYSPLVKMYYRYVAGYCMASVSKLNRGDRVLDIGCGVGILVDQFNQLGYQAVGVDVNTEAIKNSLRPEKCFLVGTTAKLNFPDNYFDLVVSREVLEHISETEIDACISEWDRVGKGKMIHIIAVTERGESATADPVHVNVKPEKWWREKFKSHGYKVVIKPRKLFFSPFGSSGYFYLSRLA